MAWNARARPHRATAALVREHLALPVQAGAKQGGAGLAWRFVCASQNELASNYPREEFSP